MLNIRKYEGDRRLFYAVGFITYTVCEGDIVEDNPTCTMIKYLTGYDPRISALMEDLLNKGYEVRNG